MLADAGENSNSLEKNVCIRYQRVGWLSSVAGQMKSGKLLAGLLLVLQISLKIIIHRALIY